MSGYVVELVRREDGALVEATLHDDIRPADLLLIERAWYPVRLEIYEELLRHGVPRSEWPESLHWDWSKKAPELGLLRATGFGIVLESSWEGVMLTKTAPLVTRLPDDKGKPLVYIDYLEAAPWNWRLPPIGREGRYKGIGSLLFREAVRQSLDEGFHGRVGLHSLPQSEVFYEQVCGMTAVGRDPDKQDLLYYEFSREQARRFLEEGGAP